MRFVLSIAGLTLALSGAGVAHAQETPRDPARQTSIELTFECPDLAIGTAADGGDLSLDEQGRELDARPRHPHEAPSAACRDANDPRCSPIPATPDAPWFASGSPAVRWLDGGFHYVLAGPALAHRVVPGFLVASEAVGPRGTRSLVERPPQRG